MTPFFHRWYRHWRALLRERGFVLSLLAGAVLLMLAWYVNYKANIYTNSIEALTVDDVILSHLPVLDLRIIYTIGIYIVMLIFPLYPIFFRPELVPFTAKTLAAFIIIRAAFISMTHLGPPEGYFQLTPYTQDPGFFDIFFLNDLFFSGHTGTPFLAALLFWDNVALRSFLLSMTFLQGWTVLFMHVHYSIDVFSAPFFTYAIYVFSDRVFNKLNRKFKKIVQRIEFRLNLK